MASPFAASLRSVWMRALSHHLTRQAIGEVGAPTAAIREVCTLARFFQIALFDDLNGVDDADQ